MKTVKKKLFKKVTVAMMVICLLGMQVPSALADCTSDLNTCETIASNNFNNCFTIAFTNYSYCWMNCGGDTNCQAACLQSLNDQCESCLNAYNAALANCQATYNRCIRIVHQG
jgi:hypothetical protein